ncbi:DUF924 family protein [Nitratireductor sp. XY-223]|uniref:DUF924 family protein n=1 Tax=Nitratireductor sp. XY-223 TaxID=2561926 RepID=UPI0010AA0697|nr:DUF924 family protein [Nitratireductor sp. XY-223]
MDNEDYRPEPVLDLWFPNEPFWESAERFSEWIKVRMYGGMDQIIARDFADLTLAAARSELDHWTETAEGRVALLIALDQFPRSLWRDTPAAYAQDIKANLLILEGIEMGHFAAVKPWKKMFYLIALSHCEGPDHLDRIALMEKLTEVVIAEIPPQLSEIAERLRGQNAHVRSVIERFGRHPHRNAHLGRVSSAEEEIYIEKGDFPHLPKAEA